MAFPYACLDQRGGPSATAYRQLKPDVLSASIEVSSLPLNASMGSMRRIGKRSARRRSKTVTTADATDAWTTRAPVWPWSSKPQYSRLKRRSWSAPAGHPGRQDPPRSAAVTGEIRGAGVVVVVVVVVDDVVAVAVAAAAVVVGMAAR